MPNAIKSTGADAVALQVTREARDAELVDEQDDDVTRLAEVNVYAVDGALLVIDRERVADADVVELVTAAAKDTGAIYPGASVSISIRGDGYQVPLPGAADAGFHVGDTAPTSTAPGVLVIVREGNERLARDLRTIREGQVA